ncbi:hypothetical protein KC717_06175 [Candidatus Dojkabacteria bacterium]|uniref:Uncharacterized protein n=1 Tax=Candidatus Dojkabacteria bacterium TaxID=2099670 RepID=A0A955L9U4_9BACT|nr:hypothetical protein [Candidatus Dojkabacteria bacterium]
MNIIYGVIAGVIFGIIDVLLMIPIKFDSTEKKKIAMLGAFLSRFAIGVLIFNTSFPFPSWLGGLVIGLLVSAPDAIITKSYIPIFTTGVIGGITIGIISSFV